MLIKLRAIGDVVLATPALAEARRAFPRGQIDFLTEPPSRQVLEGNPDVDELLLHDRQASLATRVRFLRRLRAKRYDLVIDLFGNPRSALLTLLTGAATRVGFNFRFRQAAYNVRVPARGHLVHEVEFNLDALRAIGVQVGAPRLHFPVPEPARQYAQEFVARNKLSDKLLIGLNNSGGWPAKRWLPERVARLAQLLVKRHGATVLLLWGPGEQAQAEQIAAVAGQGVLLAPPTDLHQLAALLADLRLLVTTDSAPMHIAAAVGTPVVALFGPTNPLLQGPFGPGHIVVRNESLSCLGCNRTVCEDGACMRELAVETVYAACAKALSTGQPDQE
ncbi:MAG: glycosyltransferase family 9 protein [bacterium]|nr:glycosyltransferase family 9 protein [candidate division KSB1 bacterium]MDH7558805.1 glycosyltransferase family 9 protein [bacterium]